MSVRAPTNIAKADEDEAPYRLRSLQPEATQATGDQFSAGEKGAHESAPGADTAVDPCFYFYLL